jgi:hypothetical protein
MSIATQGPGGNVRADLRKTGGGCQGKTWLQDGEGPLEIGEEIGQILDADGNSYKTVG